MAAPVYSAGSPGNLINGVAVTHGAAAIAAFLDLSTCIEGQVTCEVITSSPAPTAITAFSAYKAYAAGASPPATLGAAASTGATSLTFSSTTGFKVGQKVCLQQHASGSLGELAAISAISGTTVTVSTGILNSYASGDYIYLMAQTATFVAAPSNSSGAYATNSDFSTEIFLGPGQWIIAAQNTDASSNVTATVTVDKITSIQ